MYMFWIQALKVTMKKHPSSFKLQGELAEKLKAMSAEALTLYDGMQCVFYFRNVWKSTLHLPIFFFFVAMILF